MKAVWYEAMGPSDQVLTFGEMGTPAPGPGEVLVRMQASGVNPSDVKARAGLRGGPMPFPRIIPHSDGAGVITAAGSPDLASRIGEPVWIWNGQWARPFGTAAEYIALPAEQAVPRPEGVDAITGASLGIPALTAAHAVLGDGPVEGLSVLVSGAMGRVGRLAAGLAAARGARVIATVGDLSDMGALRDLGVDRVLSYRDADLTGQVIKANGGAPVDRAIEVEFGQNAGLLAEVIAPRGRLVAYGSAQAMRPELPFGPLLFKGVRLDFVLVYLLTPEERARAIAATHAALADGAMRVADAQRFPLSAAAQAHRAVEAGVRAPVIVEIG